MPPHIATEIDLLVVDSEAKDYHKLSKELDAADVPLVHANDGHHALCLASGKTVRLWISNMQLPDMSGIDLLKIVRAKRPMTPFYLVSNNYSVELERQARAAGAAGYLHKPADHTWFEICCSTLARLGARASPRPTKSAFAASLSSPVNLSSTHSYKES